MPAQHLLASEPLPALQPPAEMAPECSRAERRNIAATIVPRLLLAVPAIWLGYLMFSYAVDVPYGDQWDAIAPLFAKMRASTLGFGDFFAFHNEHRILFPRLLIFPLGKLTHWNVRAEVGLIWVLACLCSVNIWRIAVATGFRRERSFFGLFLLVNVLVFTPMQWENVLWGFQVGFFLPLVTITALPWAASATRRSLNFVLTIILCLVTTFSIASGFSSWLLAAPLLWFGRDKRKSRREGILWVIWSVIAVASVLVYFHGYKGPDRHPNQWEALQEPILLCQFILAYLGNPFCGGTQIAPALMAELTGGTLLVFLVAAMIYLWRWRKDRQLIERAMPWVSLSSFTLISAALTMFGRINYGVDGAIQSRYVSFAVLLPIALLFLGALVGQHCRARDPRRAETLRLDYAICLTVFAILCLFSTIGALRVWPIFQHDRLTGKAVLAFRHLINEPRAIARYVHHDVERVRGLADALDGIGYVRPERLHSAHLREIARPTGGMKMGALQDARHGPDGQVVASGWAILPLSGRVADSVILAYDKDDGDPIIFGRANVNRLRDDIAAELGDTAYRGCGWELGWSRGDVPKDATRITAWAFDAEKLCAYEVGFFRL